MGADGHDTATSQVKQTRSAILRWRNQKIQSVTKCDKNGLLCRRFSCWNVEDNVILMNNIDACFLWIGWIY